MTAGVYEIINKETNQSYIGRSINIETRWTNHKSAPTENMFPTIELYEKNPEMVEWNIISEIDTFHFDREEQLFITSVCELYEINKRGGWESDNLINGKDGSILPVRPTILSKREFLPDYVSTEDILEGIEKWTERWEYRKHFDPIYGEECEYMWEKRYEDLNTDFNNILVENVALEKKLEEIQSDPVDWAEKMKEDYEYFKLEQSNNILQDEVDKLKNKANFWETRCVKWRKKYHELRERTCKNRS